MGTQSTKSVVIDIKLISDSATKNIQELNTKIGNLKAVLKGMEDQGLQNSETYLKLTGVLKDMQSAVKANEKAIAEEIKAQKSNGDSINAMRAQLKLLRQEYENLSKSDRESSVGKQMLSDIDNLTTALKKAEFAQQDFSRQVGEYDVITKPARTALREMRLECQNMSVALDGLRGKMEAQSAVVRSLAASVGTEADEYKEAAAELDRLNAAYADTTENLNKMEQEAGKLADTISDSSKRIRSFADDNQRIAAMQEGIGVLTSAYTVLQGAMAALGVQSEELLQVYAKIQIVQQSINSLMTIYKALNKDSNLMIAARIKFERLRMQWTSAYNAALAAQNAEVSANTAAQAANAAGTAATAAAEGVATGATLSLTAAFKAMNTVLKSNPFVAAAAVVIAAVSGVIAIVRKLRAEQEKAAEEAEAAAERTKKAEEDYKAAVEGRAKAVESATKKYDEQIARVNVLLAVLRNESAQYAKKKDALRELIALIPEYNGRLDSTGKFIEGNIELIDKYIAKMREQAKAAAYTEMLTQSYLEQTMLTRQKLQAEADRKWYESQRNMYANMLADLQPGSEAYKNASKTLSWYMNKMDMVDDVISAIDNDLQRVNKEIALTEKMASDAGVGQTAQPAPKPQRPKKDASGNDEDKERQDAVKAAEKTYNELLGVADDFYKSLDKMRRDSVESLYERERMRYEEEAKALNEALARAQAELENPAADLEKINDLIDRLQQALIDAADQNGRNIAKIREEADLAYETLVGKLKESSSYDAKTAVQAVRERMQRELEAIGEEERLQLESHEWTEQQKAEISRLYAEKRVRIEREAAVEQRRVWMDTAQNILGGMQQTTQAFSTLFSVMAENDEEMQKYANALAMANIMVNMAQGIASAVAKGMEMGWPAAAIMIPVGIATIVSGIAEAISVFKKAKTPSAPQFAEGGLVGNRTTRRKDDTVTAKLSLGEYVIPSAVVQALGVEFFDALTGGKKLPKLPSGMPHFAAGGLVQTPNVTNINAGIDYDTMSEVMRQSVADALTEMPAPVVSVKEISREQSRVRVKERVARS